MKKNLKFLIVGLILASVAHAKSMSIDEAIDIYYKNSSTVKNIKLDENIRKETTKDLLNEINKDLSVSATTAYSMEKEITTVESKISYKDAFISITPSISNNSVDYTTKIGLQKTLNEFLYNTDKAQIFSNKVDNLNNELTAKQDLRSSLSSFGDKYLELLSKENAIKSTETLLTEKEKELDIAKIKKQSSNISDYDVKVIELGMEELKTKLEIAFVEKAELQKELKNLLGIDDNIEVTDVSHIADYKIYKDDSSIKIMENKINLAKDELNGLKSANLPKVTAGVNYYLEDAYSTMSLGFTWLPLDYKGDEKSKELSIQKLQNQLEDAKKSYDLTNQKTEDSIKKLQLNTDLSKRTLDLAKLELEKYKTMKNSGNLSEYDYFDKQKKVLDDEISYLNNLNSLNLAKKLQNIYSNM